MQQYALEIERPDAEDDAWPMEFRSGRRSRADAHRRRRSFGRAVACRPLRPDGLQRRHRGQRDAGISQGSRTQPDVLIIDVNMPEVDGLSVCAHLLARNRAPVNVIVITGSRNPDTLERCEGLGAFYARKGPNFWRDLEAALAEINPRHRRPDPAIRSKRARVRSRPCVLLVDDDNDINRFLASRLEKCGVDVGYAGDAYHAFRMARRNEPAVIVTDYFMPNGDAEYLLAMLRPTRRPRFPVVVLTGRHLDEVVDQRLRREIGGHPGAAHVLRKSADNAALFETLKQFCGFDGEHSIQKSDGPSPEIGVRQFRSMIMLNELLDAMMLAELPSDRTGAIDRGIAPSCSRHEAGGIRCDRPHSPCRR